MHGYILIKGDRIPVFSFGHIENKDDMRQPGGRGRRESRREKRGREGRSGDWRKWGEGRVGQRRRRSTPLRQIGPIRFPTEGDITLGNV